MDTRRRGHWPNAAAAGRDKTITGDRCSVDESVRPPPSPEAAADQWTAPPGRLSVLVRTCERVYYFILPFALQAGGQVGGPDRVSSWSSSYRLLLLLLLPTQKTKQ